MDRNELIGKLDELAHLEYDAQRVYSEALPCVHEEQVAAQFRGFLEDHVRHYDTLAEAMKRLGGAEPDRRFDAVGRYVDWKTTPHARQDCEGALAALEAAEHYHSFRYLAARTWDLEETDVAQMLQSFADDEDRHRTFVGSALQMLEASVR